MTPAQQTKYIICWSQHLTDDAVWFLAVNSFR